MQNSLILQGEQAETQPVHDFLYRYGLYPHLARIALGPIRDPHPSFSVDISAELMDTGIAAVSAVLTDRRNLEIPVKAVFTRAGANLTGFSNFGRYVTEGFTTAVRESCKILSRPIVAEQPTLLNAGFKITHKFHDIPRFAMLSIVAEQITDPVSRETLSSLLPIQSLLRLK